MRLYAPVRILRRLRKQRKWSFRQLAGKVGCNPSLAYKIERGERGLTLDRLIDYARAFNMRPGDLFDAIAEERRSLGWRGFVRYLGVRKD